jgi:plasmid stability protein
MGAIQVKNVPDDLHAAIRHRATQEGVTVGEYVLDTLRRDLAVPSRSQWLARVATREPVDGPDTTDVIDRTRAERADKMDRAGRR